MHGWQKDLVNGLTKGQLSVVVASRRSGKSRMLQMMMESHMQDSNNWSEWEDKFIVPWKKETSSISGKKIWGRVKYREKRFHLVNGNGNGHSTAIVEFATPKEVFTAALKGR